MVISFPFTVFRCALLNSDGTRSCKFHSVSERMIDSNDIVNYLVPIEVIITQYFTNKTNQCCIKIFSLQWLAR